MNLDDYLAALRACPDEQLRDECGIYDNFSILLHAPFQNVVDLLIRSSNYALIEKRKEIPDPHDDRPYLSREGHYIFHYPLGHAGLQVRGYNDFSSDEQKHTPTPRQLEYYPSTIMLHPHSFNVFDLRDIARILEDLAQLIQREHIPACFPNSMGWKHRDDYERIVYFP
ncbi:hypothetical protein HZB02_00690 [Candidatus Woesearchaeota archaeon]|nr:hypothetical protein [Candidatus Woesearchaeota archaeon]